MTICLPDPVLSKPQNYRLWQGGAFGNKLRAWRSVDEWRESGFDGMVVLRTLMEEGGGPCRYNLPPEEVDAIVDTWLALGIPLDKIMVNEAAPDGDVILQGEYLNDIYVMDEEAGWGYFKYSRARAQMRDALATAPETAQRLRSDLLLKLAAQRLTTCVRAEDTVARLGGDEFVVILSGLSTDEREAASRTEGVAEKIRTALNHGYQLHEHVYHSSPSIGASLFCGEQTEVEALLKQADLAMYKAKDSGGDRIHFYAASP